MKQTQFVLRTHQRVPIATSVSFANHAIKGNGHVWNLSRTGCRVDGNVSVLTGTRLTLMVLLPGKDAFIVIRQARVVWSRGQEFGLRLVQLDSHEACRLEAYVRKRIHQAIHA